MEIFDLIKKTYQGQAPKGMFTGSQPALTNLQQVQKDVKPITDSIVEGFKNPNETPFKYLRIKNYNAYPQHDIRSQKPVAMEQGGNVPTNNSLNVMTKLQFNRVDPNLSNMTPNFYKGGAVKNNKPYYSWDVKGETGALGLPGDVSIYNQYPTGSYNTAFIQNKDGGHELIEFGKAAGIKSEIYNKYDKDGILQHSDSTFNGYSNKTPEGKAFQKRFENNIYDMTYKKYQQGGELSSNLGQLAKAAFQMANELKKQGAISEVAGEQVIAQAFQQTPEAAKMFVEAAQKQDVQTIVQLFTKLGIVK